MDKENNFAQYYVAALVILISIVLFLIYRSKRSTRRAVLLTGLCNSGKTLLYSRLVHGHFTKTHTSMKENTGEYIINGTSLRIIDIPGHERVRNKFFEQYKTEAKAIIYVIDSNLIQKEVRDIAEYLYNILSNPAVMKRTFNILVLCNKQDIAASLNSNIIKSLLEKELTTLLLTKSSQLESVDPKLGKDKILISGEKFDFSLLPAIKVEFIECNATNGDDESANLKELEKWLLKIA